MSLQDDINNLVEDPASVSWSIKIVAILILMGVIAFLGYKLFIIDDLSQIKTAETKETGLRKTYVTKQQKASQLEAYKVQLEEMRRSFGSLKGQLPSHSEIPGLILDISDKGLTNGLQIDSFKPKPEILREFYAETPIQLAAKGTYNELASFVSDISGLPRIVTIHNIKLEQDEDGDKLVMEAIIKTYRYLDEDEVEDV